MDARANEPLDELEIRMLALVAAGHGVRRVARALSVSESTLRRKMRAAQVKLGGNSRINAVYIAAKRGLI